MVRDSKTPATNTQNDDAYQEAQGRYWIALAEGNTAEAERIQKRIKAMKQNKGGLLAKLMSGGK